MTDLFIQRFSAFYVWYACGIEDIRLLQSDNQAREMGVLRGTFNASNFSYHIKEGGATASTPCMRSITMPCNSSSLQAIPNQ